MAMLYTTVARPAGRGWIHGAHTHAAGMLVFAVFSHGDMVAAVRIGDEQQEGPTMIL